MFGHLEIFQLAQNRAIHASARQSHIAANIAHANTPGYRATDVTAFSKAYNPRSSSDVQHGLKTSRSGHVMQASEGGHQALSIEAMDRPSGTSPNGNTVSVEVEMLSAIDADRAHNRAVTIYETALGILRTSIRSGR